MDFTIEKYKELLQVLINEKYSFQTFEEFLKKPEAKSIVLRHDVDLMPGNSLRFAQIQNSLGIKGSYYFRAVPESWDEDIIKRIASLDHEVGYHYECLTTCKGNLEEGIKNFEENLQKLRKLVTTSTICMHGSPMSKYDSKDLWKHYSYRDYDIIGEPYFDVNYHEVFYVTDTGRRWNGDKVSVRDRVDSNFTLSFQYTDDIIEAANKSLLPDKIMFTFHPQRWNNSIFLWIKELILQNVKNVVKKLFFVK